MLKAEWQSIRKDKMQVLSIAAMFIMPILYCGMLLWAFWDPYGHLDQLPVAIVNEDKGAELEGEQLALGEDLADNLLESETFQFIEVDGAEAEQRLLNGEYYILIKIPKNFSQHATTLLDESPEKLQIEYMVNEGNNFLSSKIGDSAIKSIRDEVNEKVAVTYAEQLFDAIARLGGGFAEASDGAVQLKDGAVRVADGAEELKSYLAQLAQSTVTLSDGTQSLYEGIQDAADGASKLEEGSSSLAAGSEALRGGTASLHEGAAELKGGLATYVAGVNSLQEGQTELVNSQQQVTEGLYTLADGTSELSGGLSELSQGAGGLSEGIAAVNDQLSSVLAQLPEEQKGALQQALGQLEESSAQLAAALQNVTASTATLSQSADQLAQGTADIGEGQKQVLAGIGELSSSGGPLLEGAASVEQGAATIAGKLDELSAGAQSLADGTSELSGGLAEIISGTSTLKDGTSALSSKSGDLAEGGAELANGSRELVDGTTELSTALAEASEEAEISVGDENYEMAASPVEVDRDVKNEVENYGTGLAPYFISLGLFVGALLLTNVYPFVQPAVHPTGAWSWFISKSIVPFIVWIFQVGIVVTVLKLGLGLHTESFGLFILTAAVTSFAFLAIVQMLTVLLGDVGRFVSLVFLIVQLASSAGTFPVELIPDKLQFFHDFMPMTYSVKAFRAVISSGDMGMVTDCLAFLGVVGAACITITFTYFAFLYKRRYSKSI